MKRRWIPQAIALGSALLAGCASSGLSPRTGSLDYADFIYERSDRVAPASEVPAPRLPTNLAVAQLGENAPPSALIDSLKQRPDLFSSVQPIPLPLDHQNGNAAVDERMRRIAASTGAEHVLIVGGSADSWTEASALSFLDIAIVPAYVVPSRKLTMDVTATGAFIDVDSGALLALVNSEATDSRYTASAYVEDARAQLAHEQMDGLGKRLAERLVADLETRWLDAADMASGR